ncbi:MAG: hypothetical protein AABW48_02665 [Nanoarchaeota archaeon]
MATNKNRKQLKLHRTPPQPRRKSLFQTAGEVSKPFLITIITGVAILALLILLLFSKQFVGRALYTGLEGTAGLEVGPVVEGEPFTAIVKTHIGAKQTSTLGFTLDLPNGLSCDNVFNLKGLLLNAFIESLKCENGQIVYVYTTVGSPHTGEIKMAQITFKPLAVGSYSLKFSQFEIIDAQNNIISLNVLNPTIEVKKKEEVQQCPQGKECCGGVTPIDLQTDKNNCGECNNQCNGETTCKEGVCMLNTCGNNQVDLGEDCDLTVVQNTGPIKTCVDLGFTSGELKCAEQCIWNTDKCTDFKCTPQQIWCSNQCVDVSTDKDNCGSCGMVCTQGESCLAGQCLAPQPPLVCVQPESLCNEQCVNIQTDKNNCYQCGKVCEGLQSCVAGKCTAQCTGETPDTCGGNCVNLQKDSLNCGQCNKACAEPYVCLNGKCSENVQIYASCTLNTDCKEGYECKAAVCTLKSTAQLPGLAAVPPSVETVPGKKVTLTEIAPANNVFSTLITATEDFTSEVLVYTVLYGADNKVLSLQTEKIVGGLKKGSSYTATVNYLQSSVKKKTVLLYDVETNPQVHALLEKTYG